MPPYTNGNLNSIHPSVHDFGAKWNGYRWWMANTPYPPEPDENPCIYVSNDMVNWEFAPGAPVPIDPTPTVGYNSDTELCVDDAGNLVCFYRDANPQTGNARILARVSPDGSTWGDEVVVIGSGGLMSPAVVRWAAGDFRMWLIGDGTVYLRASHPLGPWEFQTDPTVTYSYHGDVIRCGNILLMANRAGNAVYCYRSTDGGSTWLLGPAPVASGGLVAPYRCTIAISDKPGWIDMWYAGTGTGSPIPNSETRTVYTRVPLSAFGV